MPTTTRLITGRKEETAHQNPEKLQETKKKVNLFKKMKKNEYIASTQRTHAKSGS
jgi:hypothetical protein